jgi:hypothetical protein
VQKIILTKNQSIKIKNTLKNNNLTHVAATYMCGISYPYFERIINGKCVVNQKFVLFIKDLDENLYNKIFPNNYNIYPRKSTSNLSVFLEQSREKWYWMGFLLADGHFTDRGISLSVSVKDKGHLTKFQKFVGHRGKLRKVFTKSPSSNNVSECISMWAGGSSTVLKLKKEFDIRSNKTYNPPQKLPTKSIDKLLSLLVGLIDGDGSIPKRKNGSVTIEIGMHKSWEQYVKNIIKLMYEVCGETYSHHPYYNKNIFCIQISNPIIIKFLKRKAKEFNLPFLKRKWDIIDENKIGRYEIRRRREKLLPALIEQGHSLQNISDMLNIHKSNLCRMIKRLNLISPHQRKTNN